MPRQQGAPKAGEVKFNVLARHLRWTSGGWAERLSVYCAYTGMRPVVSDGVRSRSHAWQKWLIFRAPTGHHRPTQDVINGLSRRRPRVQVPSTPLESLGF